MKRLLFSFVLTSALAQTAFAGSSQPDRVVELFTSQGCSSCPPANRIVTKVSDDPDTLALSYGVTYWDYLGWKDTFADPKFTQRQKSYGRVFEMGHLYTPQLVLNGASHGSRYSQKDIRTMDLPTERPRLELMKSEDGLSARIVCEKPYKAVLVEYVYGPQTVPVKAGENRGRTLTLSNVVTDVIDLGVWEPQDDPVDILPETSIGKAYALLLHDVDSGNIISAATYRE